MTDNHSSSLQRDTETLDREKLCYEQNCQQFRALNSQLNRIPAFSVTLTGGLWFGAGLHENYLDPTIRFALLLYACLSNLALIAIAIRIRDVMEKYLEKIKEFHEPSFVAGKPAVPRMVRLGDYSMIAIYCILMGLASLMSFLGALSFLLALPRTFQLGAVAMLVASLLGVALYSPSRRDRTK